MVIIIVASASANIIKVSLYCISQKMRIFGDRLKVNPTFIITKWFEDDFYKAVLVKYTNLSNHNFCIKRHLYYKYITLKITTETKKHTNFLLVSNYEFKRENLNRSVDCISLAITVQRFCIQRQILRISVKRCFMQCCSKIHLPLLGYA